MIENAIIILSRIDSKRFPNKAFSLLGGKTLIDNCVSGIFPNSNYEVILATTDRVIDDPLIEFAKQKGIKYFRGDEKNVAKRVIDCINFFKIKYFARANGDSPFLRKELVVEGFNKIKDMNCDFVTNLYPRTFPYGVSVEIFKSDFYSKEYKKFKTSSHFEHVTLFFYENIKNYNAFNIVFNKDVSDVRLTVDTEKDLELLNNVLNQTPNVYNLSIDEIVEIYRKTV